MLRHGSPRVAPCAGTRTGDAGTRGTTPLAALARPLRWGCVGPSRPVLVGDGGGAQRIPVLPDAPR
ncbi:hypothetical protein HMPREF1550_02326 [Actinomyces sp. oral taxon 877 str. F0543]|nr:hypothetical protein HMPREF1550_02326 [Actinomyces sp. oral taxon 877 str. F0543]